MRAGASVRTAGPATAHEIEGLILGYLHRELIGAEVDLGRDADLLSGGVLDSIGVLRLATFVGEEFRIDILPSDYVIENFRSVAAVADFVSRARSRTGGGDGPARR
jgi:acyl carrier protein